MGYGLGQNVIDWIISCLSERTQFTKVGTKMSGTKSINLSVVQWSGLGPCLFIILIIDLKPTGTTNLMVKYADDTSLIVPQNNNVTFEDECENLKQWAKVIN